MSAAPAGARLDQRDAAQDQRAHDALAELASAMISARSRSGGTSSASTSLDGDRVDERLRADSPPTSPRNSPARSGAAGVRWPRPRAA
jgi:hypothetical protein